MIRSIGRRPLAAGFALTGLTALLAAGCRADGPPQREAVAARNGTVRLYAVDRYEGVFRLDPHTLTILDTIDTGPRPHGLVASPDGRTLYITVETSNELLEVDVATHAIVRRVNVGPVPNEPTLSSDGRHVFVPQRGGDQTVVVDTETMQVVKTLPAGRAQHNAYTSAAGNHVYVTSMGDSLVTVIDPRTLEIRRKIHVGGVPRPVALSRDGSLAYVALSNLLGFVTLDFRTDSIVRRVERPIPPDTPPPPLDTYTHGLLLTPNERELWLAVYATDKVLGFEMPEQRQFAEITVGAGPHWFTLHPDGEPLYVSLERAGAVAAIHRGLREVLTTARVGEAPTRILAFRTPVE